MEITRCGDCKVWRLQGMEIVRCVEKCDYPCQSAGRLMMMMVMMNVRSKDFNLIKSQNFSSAENTRLYYLLYEIIDEC